jgi:hypothetical protein
MSYSIFENIRKYAKRRFVGFAPNPSRKEDVGSPACFPFGNVHPLIYSMDARHILDRIYRKPLVSGIGGECRSVPLSDIADP